MLLPTSKPFAAHARARMSAWPRLLLWTALAGCIVLVYTWYGGGGTSSAAGGGSGQATPRSLPAKPAAPAAKSGDKVLLELFVMSQCPDARFCESEFARLTANMSSLVAVRTEYIAYPNADGSVGCMHGAGECAGNLQQLCLGQHVPADKNAAWFVPALLCHGNGDVSDVGHMKGCMDKAGVTADVQAKVTACIAGPEGKQLSLKSAQEVAARGVKKSCTVYIGGKRRCIRDGGRYYDCPGGSSDAEFVASICAAAGAGVTHPACQPAAAAKAGKRLRRRL